MENTAGECLSLSSYNTIQYNTIQYNTIQYNTKEQRGKITTTNNVCLLVSKQGDNKQRRILLENVCLYLQYTTTKCREYSLLHIHFINTNRIMWLRYSICHTFHFSS